MLQTSVERQGAEFCAITDLATSLPVPTIHLPTTASRLMLWILDVSLRYLESEAFDCDTVLVSPDALVMGDLRPYFAGDVSILVRATPRYEKRPILNAVQWWPVASKQKLIRFYRDTLAVAERLPDNVIKWGADCEAIRLMLEPIALGTHARHGLTVSMLDARALMTSVAAVKRPRPTTPVVDFKYLGKHVMADYFRAVLR
jgi:hypothetical protein